jgi:hypothetical protein
MASDRRRILQAIQRESRQIKDPKARRVFRRAAVQVGLVESNLTNPSGGDADSGGFRQERRSLYPDPTNIDHAARRLRQEFQQFYSPGEKSYEVAAQVQRPAAQYRGRYKERAGEAARIVASEMGGMKGSSPNTRQGYGTTTTTTTKTVPGVDRSSERQALRLSYLENSHDPDALLSLGYGLRQSQDTPDRQVKVKTSRRQQGSPKTQGSVKASTSGVGGELKELFYGQTSFKDGKPVAPVSGHDDHVHVAAGPKSVVRLGELAQQMGLSVRENPHFDKVDPVHVAGSYHYRNQAIDVSGDPKKLRRFTKRVRKIYGL